MTFSSSSKRRGPVWKTTPATKRSPSSSRSQTRCFPSLRALGRRAGLDLDPDHGAARPARRRGRSRGDPARSADDGAPRRRRRDRRPGASCAGNEGVEDASEQVAVAHHSLLVHPQSRCDEGSVDHVALGLPGGAASAGSSPRGYLFHDKKAGEDSSVRCSRRSRQLDGVEDRLVLGDARGVERVGLEVAARPASVAPPGRRLLELLHVMGQ